ncbi:MAG: hypothetical protein ACRDF5_03240 [bacterium]
MSPQQRPGIRPHLPRATLGATAVLLLVLAAVAPAPAAPPTLNPTVIWVPEEYHTGGAYTAIQAAPDGRLYLGTTVYDGYARFLVLPPGANQFQLITDMSGATGENSPGPYAQAKIHTKPVVAPDGRIYFGTKSGKPAAQEQWQTNYPGGHLLVYDPRTGRVTDLGIAKPRQSMISLAVDPGRNLVYILTDPEMHLLVFDPRSRTFADRGQLPPTYPPTRYLVSLANGDVYHRAGADAFMRFDAETGRIVRVPLQFSGRGNYEAPYATIASLDGRRFYGVGQGGGQVYTFVPGERAIAVQLHGSAVPEGASGTGNHYTIAAAPDGHVYYTATYGRGASLYILRLNARTGSPEVLGQVGPLPPPPVPQPRQARGLIVQGSTVGPDGTLYVMLAYPLRVLVFPRLARP